MEGEGIKSETSVNGATDVMSASHESAASADHLVVMIRGILGCAADWQYGAKQFVEAFPDKVIVHCSECNMHTLTLDGVDVMGERLAEEVVELINQKPGLKKISFVSHSVGGLVARYAIGRLYRCISDDACVCDESDERVGNIYGLEAMNFITLATPHLGSRGNKQVCSSNI